MSRIPVISGIEMTCHSDCIELHGEWEGAAIMVPRDQWRAFIMRLIEIAPPDNIEMEKLPEPDPIWWNIIPVGVGLVLPSFESWRESDPHMEDIPFISIHDAMQSLNARGKTVIQQGSLLCFNPKTQGGAIMLIYPGNRLARDMFETVLAQMEPMQ